MYCCIARDQLSYFRKGENVKLLIISTVYFIARWCISTKSKACMVIVNLRYYNILLHLSSCFTYLNLGQSRWVHISEDLISLAPTSSLCGWREAGSSNYCQFYTHYYGKGVIQVQPWCREPDGCPRAPCTEMRTASKGWSTYYNTNVSSLRNTCTKDIYG